MVQISNATVIGIGKTQFTGQDGKTVFGYRIFFSQPRDKVEGVACGNLYLSANAFKMADLELGDDIQVCYLRSGSSGKYELVG